MINYNGTRWFKCDFHLHTTASDCFEDKSITAKDWVARAIKQGLNCVAITDHNTGAGIKEIQDAAKGTDLIVFPGVEITCDTSKVHLLILFDTDKSVTDVEDFLILCGIERGKFGKKEAYTSKSILEIAEQANTYGCIVIPAHIDEYNGLGEISNAILNEFFNLEYIQAFQVVHSEFLDKKLCVQDNKEIKAIFDSYYSANIDYSTIKKWQTPVKIASEKKKALLTFSDNPHAEHNPKHGLWGIGEKYSWIKMEETPTLESLRQAFLLPDLRVKSFFENENNPYKLPNLWIKSIAIDKTNITENCAPFKVDFSPQLTTIIGGRGSGKSSIFRFLRGAFSKDIDSGLAGINEDQSNFYKKPDRSGKGVLTDDSVTEIIFLRNSIEYKISVNCIANQPVIEKKNIETRLWEPVVEESFIDFFEFEEYSQKQIYEIAQKPNSLRERIDSAIGSIMLELKQKRDVLQNEYFAKSAQIRTIEGEISGKGKLQTELKDIIDQIELYKKSNIATLLKERSKFIDNSKEIKEFIDNLELQENSLQIFIEKFNSPLFSVENFDGKYQSKVLEEYTKIFESYRKAKIQLSGFLEQIKEAKKGFISELKNSEWNTACDENNVNFEAEKLKLKSDGLSDIENFEKLTQSKEEKEKLLIGIVAKEEQLSQEREVKNTLHEQYLAILEKINLARKEFVNNILVDAKVKININLFRDKDSFEFSFRNIIQRNERFEDEIALLKQNCFRGSIKEKMNEFREIILKLHNAEDVANIGGRFKNLIRELSESQIDQLMLLMPEDEIEVQYKPTVGSAFKSLSTASAGQKTTAILTFILSYGNTPLVLDQPEDDLDNRLVYDLIVDRIKTVKEKRQIIIVTHNANIPVNGDAEYIISMDSESKYLKVLANGSVDRSEIKKEICSVMEGSEAAFDMRSKRYKNI